MPKLAANVARLSRLLTRERERLPEAYLRDPELRLAYRAYYLQANLPKVHLPLQELDAHPSMIFSHDRLKVLDIGSGPGTSLLGVMRFFGERAERPELDLTAVDAVAGSLRECETLIDEQRTGYGRPVSLRSLQCDARSVSQRVAGAFDLIILSNVLNELFVQETDSAERRTRMVRDLISERLDREGSCIIIEPALRETSRDLLHVRDGLAAGGFSVYAPCLVQSRCPALIRPKDWCHEDRPWSAPEEIAMIDRLAGLRKDSLKFSYLVLRKDGRALGDIVGPGTMRVVSEPLVTKGKREYYCCGLGGRRLMVRMDRDVTSENGAFGDLCRGDIVHFEGLQQEDRRSRVLQGTVVTRAVRSSPADGGLLKP